MGRERVRWNRSGAKQTRLLHHEKGKETPLPLSPLPPSHRCSTSDTTFRWRRKGRIKYDETNAEKPPTAARRTIRRPIIPTTAPPLPISSRSAMELAAKPGWVPTGSTTKGSTARDSDRATMYP